MALPERISLRHQLFGAWCAPLFTLFTVVGWMLIAQGLHPAPASHNAEQIARFFQTHHNRMLVGVTIWSIGCCFLAVWSVQLSFHIWKIEGRKPLWAIVQAISGFGIVVFVTLSCCLWATAAFRPESYAPETVQILNDSAWIALLLPWPILSLQMLATAAVALHDDHPDPVFPRWLERASVVGAFALFTIVGSYFTKRGLFAFDGILGYFVPMGIWGMWLDVHAWYARKDLQGEIKALPPATLSTDSNLRGQMAHA